MFCQACGAHNPDEAELCGRCNQKLLVLSGPVEPGEEEEFEDEGDDGFSFDEHLLERISILEEAVKRTADSVRQLLAAFHKQEQSVLVAHTGLGTLRELLEGRGTIRREEWEELWEAKIDSQLLALEKRERFLAVRERIAALYHGDRRDTFLAHLVDAEHALAALDVDRALSALEAAFALDGANYELAYLLGETHFNEGDSDTALGYFQRVLVARDDHYEGLVYSGVIHHERGEAARAEELLKRAVAAYPEAFLPNFSLGAVYASQGDLGRAAVFLERAVAAEAVPQALYLLASTLYEMGKTTPAIRRLREAVRLDPTLEEAYHLLGIAYLDRRWTQKALAAFRQAQRLNPRRLRYQDLVRYLSGAAGTPLPRVEGEAAEWLARGEEQLAGDQPRQALASYRRALAADPDNPTVLLSYALLGLHFDRGPEIEAVTRRLLDLDPGEMLKATACAALIEALRGQGKLREGNRVGRRLLAEGGSTFSQTIAYYEMAFNLAEMEEDLDQALDYARRSLELAPDELKQFPLAALGWVHYKRSELDKAVEYLSRSSELGPSATTLTHLGMALLASGEEERARTVLADARGLDARGGGVEQRMMECMKDSARLLERVRTRHKK